MWLKAQTMKETIRAMKKFLAAIPDGKKPKYILSDQGTEYGKGSKKSEFSQFIASQNMQHKFTPAKTPAKHIERFNRSLRDASRIFRTTYKTKRVKDYILAFSKRYNNQQHERIGTTPNKVLKMNEKELAEVRQNMIR